MRTSTNEPVTRGQFLPHEKTQDFFTVLNDVEKIYVFPERTSELSEVIEKMQIDITQFYESAVESNNARKKIFYSNFLKSFEVLKKLDSDEFAESSEVNASITKAYRLFSEDLERAFHQLKVDGNVRRVVEVDTLREDLNQIRLTARKKGIEI